NLAELSRDYFSFIAGEFEAKNSSEAEYYYGMKPIIYKTCPRYVAIRLKEAWGYYNEQNYKEALRLFKEILTLTNNYSALMGYANSLFSTGEESETISFLKERINNFKHTSYYYNIEFTLADFCSRVGDFTYARSLYNKIISENPNRTLFYLSNLREKLLETDSLIVPYLNGSDFDKYLIISAQNKNSYDYFSVPVLIDLAQSLGENYNSFLNLFKNTIIVDSYQSSFAVYRLSEYLLSNLDFSRGRKMAALSMRYDNDKNFNFILEENFNRSKWLYENGNKILSTINFK
ncbi:MAG TPA: tetratricopeptide repeat protein, partial [Ignavibacteriaceae bacterium]